MLKEFGGETWDMRYKILDIRYKIGDSTVVRKLCGMLVSTHWPEALGVLPHHSNRLWVSVIRRYEVEFYSVLFIMKEKECGVYADQYQ